MAREFIARRNFQWNIGIFCLIAAVFLEKIKLYAPEVCETSKLSWENIRAGNLDLDLSMAISSISIDYAVMERSEKIKVVSSQFEWSDLGPFK